MFDRSEAVVATLVLASSTASGVERIRAAATLRALADAAEAEAIADLASRAGWVSDDHNPEYDVVGARLVRVGADGTPWVEETLPLEIAAAKGMSQNTAGWLVRDVVNLKARHPHTWEAVQERRVPVWVAQKVAQACVVAGLTQEQAHRVDAVVAPALGSLGVARLLKFVQATILQVAPEAVRAQVDRDAQSRYVLTHPCTLTPASTVIEAKVDTADALFLEETITRLAGILSAQGDTHDTDHRRATALGILANPAYALTLLGLTPSGAVDHTRPRAQVYVHLSGDTLATATGVARVESLGPVLVDQLSHILKHSRIKLTPVLRIADTDPAVDAYEIPHRIRDQVILRDRYEVFPYSSREARHQDLDHTIPFDPGGPPGQTRPSNLGPLSRRAHRAKTHGGWTLDHPSPGIYLWHSPRGQTIAIGPWGTTRLDTT